MGCWRWVAAFRWVSGPCLLDAVPPTARPAIPGKDPILPRLPLPGIPKSFANSRGSCPIVPLTLNPLPPAAAIILQFLRQFDQFRRQSVARHIFPDFYRSRRPHILQAAVVEAAVCPAPGGASAVSAPLRKLGSGHCFGPAGATAQQRGRLAALRPAFHGGFATFGDRLSRTIKRP